MNPSGSRIDGLARKRRESTAEGDGVQTEKALSYTVDFYEESRECPLASVVLEARLVLFRTISSERLQALVEAKLLLPSITLPGELMPVESGATSGPLPRKTGVPIGSAACDRCQNDNPTRTPQKR
jgi:hypothetical protein